MTSIRQLPEEKTHLHHLHEKNDPLCMLPACQEPLNTQNLHNQKYVSDQKVSTSSIQFQAIHHVRE